jgi:two-component system sensor histidine kinase BaeS
VRITSLRIQLAILLSVLSLLLVGAILLAVSTTFDRGFQSYLNQAAARRHETVATALAEALRDDPRLLTRFSARPHAFDRWIREYQRLGGPGEPRRPPPRPPRGFGGQPWPPGPGEPPPPPGPGGPPPDLWLLNAQGQIIAGPPLPPGETVARLIRTPVAVGSADARQTSAAGQLSLAWRPVRAVDNQADTMFLRQQQRLFAWIAALAVLVSVGVSWPLSRYLVTPLQRLSRAVRALADRRYDTRVAIEARNELGDLGRDFNRMAEALQAHDAQQRQWLADVSHELRTPLGVLRGELEGLQDGVVPFDGAAVDSLHEEVSQLSRLVDDLHLLAITQSGQLRYRFEPVDLAALMARLEPRLSALMVRAGLRWQFESPSHPVMIRGDEQRLEQLVMNLAQNSVRYTDSGGVVRVGLRPSPTPVLSWEDSAPGVEAADLEHLFDRFYRVEKSRQRAVAGSGLGLSIVSNIAKAHQARLQASASDLGGLRITVQFNPRA